VLVVGMGNSGTEIARDLAAVAQVTLAIRSGITAVPRYTLGVPTSYLAVAISRLPPTAQRVVRTVAGRRVRRMLRDLGLPLGPADLFPVIGLEIFDAIRSGQVAVAGGLARFQPDAVEFVDGSVARYDTVVLATGYRAALDYLAGVIDPPDDKKTRLEIRAVPTVPNLYFVGLWYDNLLGTLYIIGRQSQAVARAIHTSRATHLPDSWFTPLTPADEPSA
jgi:cation diffusion facilitator CzcD-associated flavoprotein CzcO